jgi:hypothetical protein
MGDMERNRFRPSTEALKVTNVLFPGSSFPEEPFGVVPSSKIIVFLLHPARSNRNIVLNVSAFAAFSKFRII